MRPDPEIDALITELLDSGVAPKYVARLTAELQEHYADLEEEALRSGAESADAAADALERLGRCSLIAEEFAKRPELKCWVYKSAWLALLLRATAGGYLALATPIRALTTGPDALMRYMAAATAGTAVTVGILLSMNLAVSSGGWLQRGAAPPRASFVTTADPQAETAAGGAKADRGDAAPRVPEAGEPAQSGMPADADEPRGGRRGARADGGERAPPVDVTATGTAAELPELPSLAAVVPSISYQPGPPAFMRADARLSTPRGDPALRPIVADSPDYPRAAAARGLEGHVVVEYTVSRTGAVEEPVVVESSHPIFERAALDAARQFRFEPKTIGGHPVAVRGVRTTVRFLLES